MVGVSQVNWKDIQSQRFYGINSQLCIPTARTKDLFVQLTGKERERTKRRTQTERERDREQLRKNNQPNEGTDRKATFDHQLSGSDCPAAFVSLCPQMNRAQGSLAPSTVTRLCGSLLRTQTAADLCTHALASRQCLCAWPSVQVVWYLCQSWFYLSGR